MLKYSFSQFLEGIILLSPRANKLALAWFVLRNITRLLDGLCLGKPRKSLSFSLPLQLPKRSLADIYLEIGDHKKVRN